MRRRRNAQPDLRPVYVQPTFDSRERTAKRDWCRAAYRGDRYRPKPGDFDPLWLRLGLRMNLIEQRAGWVVSNPLYDESLRRAPAHDPSLPGPGWLWEVYRWHKTLSLVTLPSARCAIERRLAALRAAEEPAAMPTQAAVPIGPVQQPLFSSEEAA
jgi:hypothetical protein